MVPIIGSGFGPGIPALVNVSKFLVKYLQKHTCTCKFESIWNIVAVQCEGPDLGRVLNTPDTPGFESWSLDQPESGFYKFFNIRLCFRHFDWWIRSFRGSLRTKPGVDKMIQYASGPDGMKSLPCHAYRHYQTKNIAGTVWKGLSKQLYSLVGCYMYQNQY